MFKVLTCISGQHDWRLVALAALICVASMATTFLLFAKTGTVRGRERPVWFAVIGLVAGSGVWATHFVAMLAYAPTLKVGYAPGITAVSWLAAVLCSGAAFRLAAVPNRKAAAAGGALFGAGVGLMHYLGMAAFEVQGWLLWDFRYVAASIIIGAGLAVPALLVASKNPTLKRLSAAMGLLTLAICGLHFTAMAAVTVVPGAGGFVPNSDISRSVLALAVLTITVCVTASTAGVFLANFHGRMKSFDEIREAVEVMPGGLAIFETDDSLLAWNPGYEKIVSPDGPPLRVGMHISEILATVGRGEFSLEGEELEAWIQKRVAARRKGGSYERKDPSGRWLKLDNRPTTRGGHVSIVADITELKHDAERLAAARDDAEAANRAKSEFLANMSHEIRTPMNGIIGMNAILMRTELTADQQKFAEAVRVSADCLLGIINDILDISKLEAGKVEIEQIDFSLETVIEDVVELLSPRATEKDLEIASFLDDGARRRLRGDPSRIRQIVLNLLSNALKFTERGYVSVEVSSRPAGPGHTALRVEIHDTGIGLTAEAKTKLFQKFQQADGSITRRFGGTGLGLSISRQLVELMDGVIGVEDRRGGGSVFWFELTLPEGEAQRQVAQRGLNGVRVLVVDDIELNRSIFMRQLEGEGAIVAEAAGGVECLRTLRRAEQAGTPFDIVLMDHMMPDMAGDEVAEQIRSNVHGHQPKLVLASSIGAPASTDRAAKAGFDAFMTKPVRHKALMKCLTELLGSQAPAPLPDTAPAEADKADEGAARTGKILLAEDNAVNTLLACTLLDAGGYEVDCVTNGREAVEAVRRGQYALVLMDVQMPIMDGMEATRLIRALPGDAGRTPIVAMTANAMAHDVEACMDVGMNEHIAKPIDPDGFIRAVQRIVSGRETDAPMNGARLTDDLANLPDLDEAHLEGLARLLPTARFAAMVDVYLHAAEGRSGHMAFLAKSANFDGLAAAAHDLRGVSGNFGARRLQLLGEHLELACKAQDLAAVEALTQTIQTASTAALDATRQFLAQREAAAAVPIQAVSS